MGWLDPRLWLAVLGSCALCLLGGYLYGRHEMKGVELAHCEAEKAQASQIATDAQIDLNTESQKAEAERAKREALEQKQKTQFQQGVSNESPKPTATACPLWPDSFVRKLNAAGSGNFLSGVSSPPTVPGPSVQAPGR